VIEVQIGVFQQYRSMLENPGAPVAICALGRKRGVFVLVVDKIEEEDSATLTLVLDSTNADLQLWNRAMFGKTDDVTLRGLEWSRLDRGILILVTIALFMLIAPSGRADPTSVPGETASRPSATPARLQQPPVPLVGSGGQVNFYYRVPGTDLMGKPFGRNGLHLSSSRGAMTNERSHHGFCAMNAAACRKGIGKPD
jgi:hypothetical protein